MSDSAIPESPRQPERSARSQQQKLWTVRLETMKWLLSSMRAPDNSLCESSGVRQIALPEYSLKRAQLAAIRVKEIAERWSRYLRCFAECARLQLDSYQRKNDEEITVHRNAVLDVIGSSSKNPSAFLSRNLAAPANSRCARLIRLSDVAGSMQRERGVLPEVPQDSFGSGRIFMARPKHQPWLQPSVGGDRNFDL